jgi:hypothetical protein
MNAQPHSIWDALSQVSSPDMPVIILIVVAVATLLIIAITVTVSKTIYGMHKNRLENTLKRELVERGLSVDEIERIVAAKGSVTGKDSA